MTAEKTAKTGEVLGMDAPSLADQWLTIFAPFLKSPALVDSLVALLEAYALGSWPTPPDRPGGGPGGGPPNGPPAIPVLASPPEEATTEHLPAATGAGHAPTRRTK